jgi:hypothetical protein
MKQDKFLLAIVIGISIIGLLVVVLTLARRNNAYRTDETPEAIVQNYILALQKKDYERAYALLADQPGKPNLEAFRSDLLMNNDAIQSYVFRLETIDEGESTALVRIIQSNNNLIESYRNEDLARLTKTSAGWRLTQMPYPLWGWNWYQEEPKP